MQRHPSTGIHLGFLRTQGKERELMKRDGGGEPSGMTRTNKLLIGGAYEIPALRCASCKELRHVLPSDHIACSCHTDLNVYHPMMMCQEWTPPPLYINHVQIFPLN